MVVVVENDGSITDILATSLRITMTNAGEPEKPVRGQHSHSRSQPGAGGYQQKETPMEDQQPPGSRRGPERHHPGAGRGERRHHRDRANGG